MLTGFPLRKSAFNVGYSTITRWLPEFREKGMPGLFPAKAGDRELARIVHASTHQPARKVFFGAIHAVLELQQKYGYAGTFRVKGYLEQDYHIYLSEATIRKIMALNRQLHLAPQRPITIVD